MKIRNGFVSNSSSSSFIVTFKKGGDKCPCCGRCNENILDIIDRTNRQYSDTAVVSLGNDILDGINYLKEYNEQKYLKLKKDINFYINADYEVAHIAISYHDELLKDFIREKSYNGDLIIIHRDED